jgi:hypothetical protein
MSTVEELFKERNEVRSDLLAGKKPKRVFIAPFFTLEAALSPKTAVLPRRVL